VRVRRAIPAFEQQKLRFRFVATRSGEMTRTPLRPEYLQHLGAIMNRPYTAAESLVLGDSDLRVCESGVGYSSFNMGAGEDVLIELLATLQECPEESLVVVEEIELGLHQEAQRRLAEVLQDVALKKRLQIVVSTHSEQFLAALPKEARQLVNRVGDNHTEVAGRIRTAR
jgi:predicted ATP-dependent endonuclease of OLD family